MADLASHFSSKPVESCSLESADEIDDNMVLGIILLVVLLAISVKLKSWYGAQKYLWQSTHLMAVLIICLEPLQKCDYQILTRKISFAVHRPLHLAARIPLIKLIILWGNYCSDPGFRHVLLLAISAFGEGDRKLWLSAKSSRATMTTGHRRAGEAIEL